MNKVCLYGAAGHSKVIIDILEDNNIEIEALFDDDKAIEGVYNYKCFNNFIESDLNGSYLLLAIGNNKVRKDLSSKYRDINYFTAIDKSSNISKRAIINVGSVVMRGVSVNCGASIGKHCIINTNSSIDHDCIIDDFVHISPNVALTGYVNVGEGTLIGAGSVVVPSVSIGKWCIIGAGSVVINDVPDFSVVVGNPAKVIKMNNKI